MQSQAAYKKDASVVPAADETNETAIYEQLFEAYNDGRHDDVRKLYRRLLELGRPQGEVLSRVQSVLSAPSGPVAAPVTGTAPLRADPRRGKARAKSTREATTSRRRASPKSPRQEAASVEAASLNEKGAEPPIETSLEETPHPLDTAAPANALGPSPEFGPPQPTLTEDVLPPPALETTVAHAGQETTDAPAGDQNELPTEIAKIPPPRSRPWMVRVWQSTAFGAGISGLAVLIVAGTLVLDLNGRNGSHSTSQPPDGDMSAVAAKPVTHPASDASASAAEPSVAKATDHPAAEVREVPSPGSPPHPAVESNAAPPAAASGTPSLAAAGPRATAAKPPAAKASDHPVGELREAPSPGTPPHPAVASNAAPPAGVSGTPALAAAGSTASAAKPPVAKANDHPVGEARAVSSVGTPPGPPADSHAAPPVAISGTPSVAAAAPTAGAAKPPASTASDHPAGEVPKAPSTANPPHTAGDIKAVAVPKVSEDPPLDGPQGFPTEQQDRGQVSLLAPASASPSEPAATAAAGKAGPDSTLSEAEIAALMQRGDSLFAQGDVASARLFYERAANAGNGQAALRLGNSFDQFFLSRIGMGDVHGDLAVAARWYARAMDLGEHDAEVLLIALGRK